MIYVLVGWCRFWTVVTFCDGLLASTLLPDTLNISPQIPGGSPQIPGGNLVRATDLGSGAAIGTDSSSGGRRRRGRTRTLLAAATLPMMVETSLPSAGVVSVDHRVLIEYGSG